jgi:predicted metal-dependent hydrolase
LYPKEFIQFLAHFHGDRDYFECHEVLEEYWKKTDSRNKSSIWVGLILLAVSTYHHRRGNFSGAKRTLEKAVKIFNSQPSVLSGLGLDQNYMKDLLKERLSIIEKNGAYKSFNLPISDPALEEMARCYCEQEGYLWGKGNNSTDARLIHRHKLRDRTSILKERQQSLEWRKGNE